MVKTLMEAVCNNDYSDNLIPIHNGPIWQNPLITLTYVKGWDRRGIRMVRDLINKDVQLKTKE